MNKLLYCLLGSTLSVALYVNGMAHGARVVEGNYIQAIEDMATFHDQTIMELQHTYRTELVARNDVIRESCNRFGQAKINTPEGIVMFDCYVTQVLHKGETEWRSK